MQSSLTADRKCKIPLSFNQNMSMTRLNTLTESSMHQLGGDPHQAMASPDEHQSWRLAFDNQSMRGTERYEYEYVENDEFYRKIRFLEMSVVRNSGTKMQHPLERQQPDKWYKTLPPAETLPRNEVLGGYIFVCNNETMQEDLHRQLFGLPQKYKDSVRAIIPGLPLFLYNYTAHQLHGVFQAASFGGSNIDPTAWEDKKCRGESRFPAQVRIRIKKKCKPLEEDAFRPILYHYDGPKFRLQLSVPEALALLDLFREEDM